MWVCEEFVVAIRKMGSLEFVVILGVRVMPGICCVIHVGIM